MVMQKVSIKKMLKLPNFSTIRAGSCQFVKIHPLEEQNKK